MIKYIGSKRVLLPTIVSLVEGLPGVRRVLDLFSGTSRVGHAFKAAGYRVTANDHNAYAFRLAQCYVQADARRVAKQAQAWIDELNQLAPRPGYFTEVFCERSRFLQPKNGARVDAIREHIAAADLDPVLESVLLVSLMEAADRVDSTCGLQMAYLKQWAARSRNDLSLRLPALLPGAGRALQAEALDAVGRERFDLVYLDPPYNQHRYLGNYHVWESLVRWDKPEVYGTACKRVDCREYKSPFNSKRKIADALEAVVRAARARYLLVSFNNEGFLDHDQMCGMLGELGEVASMWVHYKRYVGAQIGIHNPRGERVGEVSHLRNREYLFLVGEGAGEIVDSFGVGARAG